MLQQPTEIADSYKSLTSQTWERFYALNQANDPNSFISDIPHFVRAQVTEEYLTPLLRSTVYNKYFKGSQRAIARWGLNVSYPKGVATLTPSLYDLADIMAVKKEFNNSDINLYLLKRWPPICELFVYLANSGLKSYFPFRGTAKQLANLIKKVLSEAKIDDPQFQSLAKTAAVGRNLLDFQTLLASLGFNCLFETDKEDIGNFDKLIVNIDCSDKIGNKTGQYSVHEIAWILCCKPKTVFKFFDKLENNLNSLRNRDNSPTLQDLMLKAIKPSARINLLSTVNSSDSSGIVTFWTRDARFYWTDTIVENLNAMSIIMSILAFNKDWVKNKNNVSSVYSIYPLSELPRLEMTIRAELARLEKMSHV
jgi:hypothetical protein